MKPYAIINSRFAEVLLLDADNVPVRNPEYLFDHPWFHRDGAILWPDLGRLPPGAPAWRLIDVGYHDEPEVESGQVLVDKRRCWAPVLLCMWYNENHAVFYKHVHGDKETFHFAFHRLGAPHALIPHPVALVEGALYQHDPDGQRLFQHRNCDKWDLRGRNLQIPDFQYEQECRGFLRELAGQWDGRIGWLKAAQAETARAAQARNGQPLKLAVVLASCRDRDALRAETLRRLAEAGWPVESVWVTMDEGRFKHPVDRLTHTAWRALRTALAAAPDYVLYLEDDLDFNRHLLENLRRWGPLSRRELEIGGLCNLGARELAWDVPGDACLIHPHDVFGSQAVLFSRRMVAHCLQHWFEGPTDLDLKLGALAGALRQPFFFHCPSLVQHVGRTSTLGHSWRMSLDFDAGWRAATGHSVELVPAAPPDGANLHPAAHE